MAIGISLLQSVAFLLSVVAQWQDRYQAASQSLNTNNLLSEEYKALGEQNPAEPAAIADFRRQLELIIASDKAQQQKDEEQGIRDKEKRMGMRAGLHEFQRRCVTCKEIPPNMKPTKCGTCGDFPKRWPR